VADKKRAHTRTSDADLSPGKLRVRNRRRRAKRGWQRKFPTPHDLWKAAVEYFEWIEDNPLVEIRPIVENGKIKMVEVPKLRAPSIKGMLLHIKAGAQTYMDYKKLPEFEETINAIEATIKLIKFEGSAAGLMNSTIISRDLELVERVSSEISAKDGEPLAVFNFIPVGPNDS